MTSPSDAVPVLLVEDDPDDVFLIEQAFETAAPHLRLSVVTDGEAAQSYLAGDGRYADRTKYPFPSLVLLDINLPKVTGLEVLEWMKRQPGLARIPVLILSSSTLEEEVERAYALDVNAYLSKDGSSERLDQIAAGVAALVEALQDEPTDGPGADGSGRHAAQARLDGLSLGRDGDGREATTWQDGTAPSGPPEPKEVP